MEDRDGLFQAARGGTLFLDEIADLPLSMQSKLLRAIQERAARPVGATQEVPTDVRLVSATHQDLIEAVQTGRFRQDLYYRLNVIRIDVPPLRERLDDLPLICQALLERMARDAGVQPVPELSEAAMERLARHPFPGNVRELENLLHGALALSGADRIDEPDLAIEETAFGESMAGPLDGGSAAASAAPPAAASAATAAAEPLPANLVAHLDAVEREILERALQRHRYNRTAAGASLGLSLRQMRYRMARLGVGVGDSGESG